MQPTKKRIESIDILRGAVMVIMALDHTRDYFHWSANVDDPLNLETTTAALFFTRWITHYCAPIFIFLAGTSIYLQSIRKSNQELGVFLFKRGLWLIFLEFTVIALAWTFNPTWAFIPMQVIWAIGISMIVLGIVVLLKFPFKAILIIGAILVLGHNLLDYPEAAADFAPGFWWDLFHSGVFSFYPLGESRNLIMVYPFPAWTGVMMLGYCFGCFFKKDYDAIKRAKYLKFLGLSVMLLFVILRAINLYGDPQHWSIQKNLIFSIMSFLDTTKYPPSLLYLTMTLGPAIFLLGIIEGIKNKFTDILVVFGRTALFFYILHLYFIHALSTIKFFATGHSFSEAWNTGNTFPFLFLIPGEGTGLVMVYVVTSIVVISLYPLCRWYNHYKSNHREKWWLGYL